MDKKISIGPDSVAITHIEQQNNYVKPMQNPLNGSGYNNFERNLYNSFKHYFMEKINVNGIDNFSWNKYHFLDKVFNGTMAFYLHAGEIRPVNITPTKFNYLQEPTNIKIIEPMSASLNGREEKISEFADFKRISEVKFNYDRMSLRFLLKPYIEQLYQIWLSMEQENFKIFDKKLINQNIIKQTKNNRLVLQNIERSRNTFHALDIQAGEIKKLSDNNSSLFEDITFSDTVTDRLIRKYEFTMKEAFKICGMKFNNAADKKGENTIEAEISAENEKSNYLFNHFINSIKKGLINVNKKFNTNISISLNEEKEEIKKESDENENDISQK